MNGHDAAAPAPAPSARRGAASQAGPELHNPTALQSRPGRPGRAGSGRGGSGRVVQGGARQKGRLAAVQWRLADEVVALGEALRVTDRPLEAAHALVVLAMRACRELGAAQPRLCRGGVAVVSAPRMLRTR